MNREYPKMLYRAAGADVANRIVASAAEHEAAKQEGWGSRKEANEAAAKAPKPAPAAAVKRDPEAAKAELKLINEIADLKQQLGAAQEAGMQAGKYEAFLRALSGDDNAPEGLRIAIAELLGDEPAKTQAPKAEGKKPAKK